MPEIVVQSGEPQKRNHQKKDPARLAALCPPNNEGTTGGSRGALGARPPLAPKFVFKIMQFSSDCKGKIPILSKLWDQGPPPGQNPGSGPEDINKGLSRPIGIHFNDNFFAQFETRANSFYHSFSPPKDKGKSSRLFQFQFQFSRRIDTDLLPAAIVSVAISLGFRMLLGLQH